MRSSKEDEWDWNVDTFDSRELIERVEYIKGELELNDEETSTDGEEPHLDDDEAAELREELAELETFANEAEGYASDWLYGETFIADRYFEDYARDLAVDIGAISGEEQWPLDCIDWGEAANELKMDYTEIDGPDGYTFWVR